MCRRPRWRFCSATPSTSSRHCPTTAAADGGEVLRRVLAGAHRFLRRGGVLLLELGGDQAQELAGDLVHAGYADIDVLVDDEGDVRGIEAMRAE